MFCPKCSHQQTSENSRYCSRCGFQLNAVAEIISREVRLKTAAKVSQEKLSRLNQPVYRMAAKLIFLSFTLVPFVFILSYIFDSPVPFVFPLLILFAGLAQMTYARLFDEKNLSDSGENNAAGQLDKHQPSLPSIHGNPFQNIDFPQRNIEGRINPPSVTEHTTKLLKLKNEPSDRDV
jgi:hypothetical protein